MDDGAAIMRRRARECDEIATASTAARNAHAVKRDAAAAKARDLDEALTKIRARQEEREASKAGPCPHTLTRCVLYECVT